MKKEKRRESGAGEGRGKGGARERKEQRKLFEDISMFFICLSCLISKDLETESVYERTNKGRSEKWRKKGKKRRIESMSER